MSHPRDEQGLRFGILGTARIAEKVAAAIQAADGASLDVIASRDADRAREWAHGHQVPRSVGDYRRVIDDPEIDAVYIPLPNSMHHGRRVPRTPGSTDGWSHVDPSPANNRHEGTTHQWNSR